MLLDLWAALIPQGGYPDYDIPKKRYVVRVGDRLLSFSRQSDALAAIQTDAPAKTYPKKKQKQHKAVEIVAEAIPDEVYNISSLSNMAQMYQAQAQYESLMRQRNYEAMIGLFQVLKEREEEDIELLLMAS